MKHDDQDGGRMGRGVSGDAGYTNAGSTHGGTAPGKRTATQDAHTSDPTSALLRRFDAAEAMLATVTTRHLPATRAAIDARDMSTARTASAALTAALMRIDEDLRHARRWATLAESDGALAMLAPLEAARDALRAEATPVLALAPPPAAAPPMLSEVFDPANPFGLDPGDDAAEAATRESWGAQLHAAEAPAGGQVIDARDRFGGADVQRRATDVAPRDPAAVQHHAQAGVAGTGGRLPHLDTIQASFGAHDVTGVRAHVGGTAASASAAIGAEAYATGNDVAFASSPSLFVAAHEAAHVVQQRAGVSLLGGVGEAGDVYEQHADAVAEHVIRGESAEALLGEVREGGSRPAVQAKKKKGSKAELARHFDTLQGLLADLRETIDAYEAGDAPELSVRILGTTARGLTKAIKVYELTNAQRLLLGQLEEDLDHQAERARDLFQARDAADSSNEVEVTDETGGSEDGLETGIPILDKGYTCEREEHAGDPGCVLTSQERRDLTQTLQVRMLLALTNYQAAIQNARIQKLTASHAGWTFLTEFLFQSVSGALIGGLIGVLIKKQAMEVEQLLQLGLSEKVIKLVKSSTAEKAIPLVKEVLTNGSRGLRGVLKGKVNSLTDSAKGHAAFLQVVQSAATMISATAAEEALTTLDDVGLIRLAHSYDIANGEHSVEYYAEIVDRMLAQYDDNGIGLIGGSAAGKTGEIYQVAQLSVFDYRRTALIKFDASKSVGSGVVNEDESLKEVADEITNGPRRHFVRWVDDDFVDLAEGVASERGSLLQLDVTVRDLINPDNYEYVMWRDRMKEEHHATAKAHDDERNQDRGGRRGDDDGREISGGR